MEHSVANTETIIIGPLKNLIPGSTFLDEQITTRIQLNYTNVGGSFVIELLQGSVSPLPAENAVLSLPFGRVGIVKNTGSGWSQAGIVDTISGSILPLSATLINFYGIEPNAAQFLSFLALFLANGAPVVWSTLDVPIKNFSFRGQAISGIQQVAQTVLADVIVRKDAIYVVDPGSIIDGTNVLPNGSQAKQSPFIVPKTDIVSATQVIDYGLDVASVLNPALTSAQLDDEGDFVYDSDHAQKQPKTQVSAGTANAGFTPIPDGWLIDGTFEEWTPVPGSGTVDNPSPTVSRYWKQFPSPSTPGNMRGVISFNRLIKDFSSQPNNFSTFVGSPVTAQSLGSSGSPNSFQFLGGGTESGIYGFNLALTVVSDIVSGQYLELSKSLTLTPAGGNSGTADINFYSIQLEFWLFPRVNPQIFPVGDPVNPFGIARNVVVVNPSSNVANIGGQIRGYWQKYIANYQLINSPRLKTTVSVVFRNNLPQVGDQLQVLSGLKYVDCGRIQNVGLSFSRSGMVINISAEKYQFGPGLYQGGSGIEVIH